jgi:hypothetical protein
VSVEAVDVRECPRELALAGLPVVLTVVSLTLWPVLSKMCTEATVKDTTTTTDTNTAGMSIPYSRGGNHRWVKCEASMNGDTHIHKK